MAFRASRSRTSGSGIDWSAFYQLPADVFGPGKVLVFGYVCDQDGTPYVADMRARLERPAFAAELRKKDMVAQDVANEIEGFIFKGRYGQRRYFETGLFEYVSIGGDHHSLPGDTLRRFIDTSAEVQRALGFANEKDHRGGALAVRDERRLLRGRGGRRPGPALQADRAAGGGADGPVGFVPAEAGAERERQRLPHQHVAREVGEGPGRQAGGRQGTCSTTRRARTAFRASPGAS